MKMKKWTAGLVALALVVGAMPALVSPASAVETGQRRDKIKFKPPLIKTVAIVVASVAVIAGIILLADDDKPTSP